MWISGDYRPENMTTNSQYLYAQNEPNGSGDCFYLSASRCVLTLEDLQDSGAHLTS